MLSNQKQTIIIRAALCFVLSDSVSERLRALGLLAFKLSVFVSYMKTLAEKPFNLMNIQQIKSLLSHPLTHLLVRSFALSLVRSVHSNSFQWAIIHFNRIPHHSMIYIVFPVVNSDLMMVSICVQIKRKFWWKAENQTIYWFQGNNFEIIFTLITIIPTIANRVRTCNGRRCSLFAKHNVPYVHMCLRAYYNHHPFCFSTIIGVLFGHGGISDFHGLIKFMAYDTRWSIMWISIHSDFHSQKLQG